MVSLYDSFSMFPAAHHPHHPAHAAAAAAAAGTPPHHPHHLLGRHQPGVGGVPAGHPHHQGVVPHHHHPHHGQHSHQMAANQAAYFAAASYSHPHHWGGGGGGAGGGGNPVGGIQQNPAAGAGSLQSYEQHQQQFGGLSMTAGADGGNAWQPSPAALAYSAAAGISSLSPARTPVTSGGGYDGEWASSPGGGGNNNPNNQSQGGGGVSSPDGSPAFHQHGGQVGGGPGSPGGIVEQHTAYGKIFVGGTEFIPPYHLAQHVQHQQHQQDLQQQQQHGRNGQQQTSGLPSTVTGHHSPDSGLAGSDGLSSAGSPAQQQQSMLGSSAGINSSMGVQSAGGSMQQGGNNMGGGQNNNNNTVSRPQPSRSPFEWMKKPSYHNNVNPAGKTRTKDKYRVVYTDHQRLELEKEFHYSRYITIRRKSELASVLGLSERQVKIWFQNRRAKERKQVKKREEMLHKEKIDVPVVQQQVVQQVQQQVQQQQHVHQQQQQVVQHMHHVVHPAQISSFGQMDTKPVMGMD